MSPARERTPRTQGGTSFWVRYFKRDVDKQKKVALEQSDAWQPCPMRTAEEAGDA